MKSALEPSECRSCGALVIWAVSANGKRNPINVTPDPKGNVLLSFSHGRNEVNFAISTNLDEYQDRKRYVSHFATCPNAGEWRKK